ncbi:MAG: hypothetical protein GX913_01765 [Clostridiales bacterium]|nr:hypothetical protein [Clostridiales bacterium]
MSNLVKAGRIITEKEKRVIDCNDLISVKLMEIKKKTKVSENPEENSEFVSGLNIEGLEQPLEQINNQEIINNSKEEAERILEEAKANASAIIEEAKIRGEILSHEIAERSKKEGFQEGLRNGAVETEKLKHQLDEEKTKQDAEHKRQLELLEPELVKVILEVFSKVFHVTLEDKEDMIQYLVTNAVAHIENSYEFIIRVSKEDYPILKKSKEKIFEEIPQISTLEIIKDSSLKKNQCLIETDGGVFDCSIDTQLEKLISDIKVLSCI